MQYKYVCNKNMLKEQTNKKRMKRSKYYSDFTFDIRVQKKKGYRKKTSKFFGKIKPQKCYKFNIKFQEENINEI